MIFSVGLVVFNDDFDNCFVIWLVWYVLFSLGLVLCCLFICFGVGWLCNCGYNICWVVVVGDLFVGQVLLDSFCNELWLGFEVVGVYYDFKLGGVFVDWVGNFE